MTSAANTATAANVAAAPVITIDGPAASGKGTIARLVADALSFHYLDSGKLYRAAALAAERRGIKINEHNNELAALVAQLINDEELLRQLLQDPALVTPETGQLASALASNAALRLQLLPLQRAAQRAPGLVADGRDMGSVVFPDAQTQIFLTAKLAIRAERRQKQLQQNGIYVKIQDIRADLRQRDRQDSERETAPLKQSANALAVDSTHQSTGNIVQTILRAYHDGASNIHRTPHHT